MCENCIPGGLTRRRVLLGAAVASAAALVPAPLRAAEPVAGAVAPDEALRRLMEGNARYVANTSINRDYSAGRAARALGQWPFATIVSCSDSRVSPELIFDQGPGDLFIVRVAGNFINEDGLASLEYGASVLGSRLIVVLGHSSCGAVAATIKAIGEGVTLPGHLPSLVEAIRPAVETAQTGKPANLLAEATRQNALLNAGRARTAQPILADLYRSKTIDAAAALYDIATGKVTLV